MMEAGSQFIEMVVGDLEGHFVGDSNQIISMDNSDGDSDGHHLGNSGIHHHQNSTEVVYTEGPNGVIMEGDEIVQEVGQDDGSGNEEYVDGHDEQIVVGNQSRLIISQERGMFVPSSQSLSSVDQPGYIAMKPGIPGQNMELGDIVYGQNTMGHIILQEGVDNEMIVEGNVEVGDDQGGSDTPHGEIILVPNTVLKQDIIESGEVIVGSNMHAQHVGNEIIIEEHTAGHGGRHHTGINLTDLDDDGAFGDSNLIIDTSAIKEENVGPSVGYDCGECGAVMKSRGALKKHIGRFHAPQEPEPLEMPNKIYSCPSCPYQTPRRDKLDKHVAKHVAEGYSPSGKKRSKTTPPQRMRHAAEEYKCPLCPYKCTVEKAFKKHMKLHQSGTKHFVVKVSCKICGKDRSSETDLRKHMKKHKEGRDFICDICGFASIQLKKIIQHRRMHTGEKPHLCPHCSYRSARRDNLRSHVRRMHKKENMYIDTFNPRSDSLAVD